MINIGLDNETISKATGLDLSEIEKLTNHRLYKRTQQTKVHKKIGPAYRS